MNEFSLQEGQEVIYKDKYTLEDLLSKANHRIKKLLKNAKGTAQSWSQREKTDLITKVEESFVAAITTSQVDKW